MILSSAPIWMRNYKLHNKNAKAHPKVINNDVVSPNKLERQKKKVQKKVIRSGAAAAAGRRHTVVFTYCIIAHQKKEDDEG